MSLLLNEAVPRLNGRLRHVLVVQCVGKHGRALTWKRLECHWARAMQLASACHDCYSRQDVGLLATTHKPSMVLVRCPRPRPQRLASWPVNLDRAKS
jgi:hypothetical protein